MQRAARLYICTNSGNKRERGKSDTGWEKIESGTEAA